MRDPFFSAVIKMLRGALRWGTPAVPAPGGHLGASLAALGAVDSTLFLWNRLHPPFICIPESGAQ
jgi:hypothetical protein